MGQDLVPSIQKIPLKTKIRLIPARTTHARLLWNWRTDAAAHTASINQTPFSYSQHLQWVKKALASKDMLIYIVRNEHNKSIGYIRFQRRNKIEAHLSIALATKYRFQGYGWRGLKLSAEKLFHHWQVKKIIALIKMKNDSSYKAFFKAGFTKEANIAINGERFIKFEKCRTSVISSP